MPFIRSPLIDKDDAAQIRAIAKWQGKNGKFALIDAYRQETRSRNQEGPQQFIPLTSSMETRLSSSISLGCMGPETVVDHIVLTKALSRLTPAARDLVERTILGDTSLSEWARETGVERQAADRDRSRILRRLSEMPEIRSLKDLR